jgi:hypothetical protein
MKVKAEKIQDWWQKYKNSDLKIGLCKYLGKKKNLNR